MSPFFFSSRRRHTRLVSDWSSDVCSSDLAGIPTPVLGSPRLGPDCNGGVARGASVGAALTFDYFRQELDLCPRSEERRVGKECRSRWAPDHVTKKSTLPTLRV